MEMDEMGAALMYPDFSDLGGHPRPGAGLGGAARSVAGSLSPAADEWEASRAGYERGRRDALAVRSGGWPLYRSAWTIGYVSGFSSVSGDGGEGAGDG